MEKEHINKINENAGAQKGAGKGAIMTEFNYVINDRQGIHARPAGQFVKEAASFPCEVRIVKDGKEVDAKRILGVMGLGAKCGEAITVKTDGEREAEAAEHLKKFLEENL